MKLALLALVAVVSAFVLAVVAATREADVFRGRLAAVEAHAADVDEALARHEHEADLEAEAWRQRCRWEMVPARTRRELVTAVRLYGDGDGPVLVDLAR